MAPRIPIECFPPGIALSTLLAEVVPLSGPGHTSLRHPDVSPCVRQWRTSIQPSALFKSSSQEIVSVAGLPLTVGVFHTCNENPSPTLAVIAGNSARHLA